MEENRIVIEAVSKNDARMFGVADSIEEAIEFFCQWYSTNELTTRQIIYAKLFKSGQGCFAEIKLQPDGSLALEQSNGKKRIGEILWMIKRFLRNLMS